ncbi:hypothetical protein L7F22_012709 [Adiantum nelumboides]|nr:hypothetical protein [Adiantum nelumboides]
MDVAEVVDVAGPSTRIAAPRSVLPTTEQARWDVKDAQAYALIALSVKHTITPHIRSAKSAKQAWVILAGLYAGRNEAKIALLRKELESKIMNEEDDMDTFLAGIKDINEQLIFAGEIISDSSLVQTVLDALPDSYQNFASTWQLMNQRNLEVVKFDEVCTLLLQEALSRKNRSRQRAVEHAFIALCPRVDPPFLCNKSYFWNPFQYLYNSWVFDSLQTSLSCSVWGSSGLMDQHGPLCPWFTDYPFQNPLTSISRCRGPAEGSFGGSPILVICNGAAGFGV